MADVPNYGAILNSAESLPQPQEGAAIMQGIQNGLQMRFGLAQQAIQMQQLQQGLAAQQAVLADPTPENIVKFGLANPQWHDAASAMHTAKTADVQRQDVQDAAGVYGLLGAGNTDGAAQILQRRVDAGQTNLAPLLQMVNSGDPAKIQQARGAAGVMLAGMMGPDKFADVYAKTSPEAVRAAELDNAQKSFIKTQPGEQLTPITLDGSAPPQGGGPVGGAQAAATGGAPAAPAAGGQVGAQMASAAQSAGASPGMVSHLGATAILESGFKPGAQNGKSTGLFQFQPGAWKDSGGGDINDVGDQTRNALKFTQRNALQLQHSLGQAPTNSQVYLAHQQGAGGAAALINADPGVPAIQALVRAGVPMAKATASILNNGGTSTMTAGQFVDMWRDRYNQAYAQYTGGQQTGQPSGPPQQPSPVAGGAPGQHYGAPGQGFSLGAPIGSTGMPNDDALTQGAWNWIHTGQMMGDGTRPEGVAINNAMQQRASALLQQSGINPSQLPALRARWSAAQSTLSTIQSQQSVNQQQEGTIATGISLVRDLLKTGAGGVSGSKLVNMPWQAFRKTLGDDPRSNQLSALLGTAGDEYAKIMGGANGATDSSRKEAGKKFDENLPVGKLLGVLDSLDLDMAGRRNSGNEQIRSQNSILISPTATATPPSAVTALRAAAKAGGAKAAAAAQAFDSKWGQGQAANWLGEM